ncbi:hypothetical protein CCMA1212_004795 [Trichoderma ghanense]|uniref:Uncharacterized protein n=1 Tax=Trichoderma ghanense TaxID=65468 RepID=A0ABY2H6B9_9HYPO
MTTAFHAHITENRQEGCSLIQPYLAILPTLPPLSHLLTPSCLPHFLRLLPLFLSAMTTSLTRPRLSSVVTGCSTGLNFRPAVRRNEQTTHKGSCSFSPPSACCPIRTPRLL